MPSAQKFADRARLQKVLHYAVRTSFPRPVVGIGLCVALAFTWLDGHGQELSADRYALAFAAAPSTVTLSPDGRELLVEFPTALPDGQAARAARALGPLLEGYSEGYGAVRFRLTTRVSVADPKGGRTIEIAPYLDTGATSDDKRRLALLRAREQARNGDVAGARVELLRISAERPGDLEPVLTLADAEIGAGRWQHALGLYDGALRLFPEATDITHDRSALSVRHGPRLRLDGGATFGPGGERAQTGTLAGDIDLGETWRAEGSIQTTHDEIRGLRRSGSTTAADYSGTKLLFGVALLHDWHSPTDTTRVDLFAAPRTMGVALKHDLTTQLGQTTIGAFYHQPYWGTVMSFAANARRDQFGFSQTIALPDQWQAQVGAGVVRYGLPADENVASGPSALAGISRGLPEPWMLVAGMSVRLGYRLESEYLSRSRTATTPVGPLPLLDVRHRELHSLYSESSLPVGGGIATASLGYALDRFGGGGPQALLRYTAGEESDRLAVSAEAGLEPSLDINPRTLFHVGASLVWRFGGG